MQGILIVDKPTDWTSFDVIAKLRGILGTRKLGHSGTLDPMATGVLPVFCGGASKAVDLQLDHTKAYRAVLRLGTRTDTGDSTGTVLETAPVTAGERELLDVLPQFIGPQMQTPPMYSAVKINGQPLYKMARQGIEVERKARPIEILHIEYEGSPAENEYTLMVRCSKGTYIRVLLEDIAAAMGQKGTMSALRRVAAGVYTEADAHTLEEIQAAKDAGPAALEALMLPVESVFESLPLLVVEPLLTYRFGRVQETLHKAVSKGLRITVGYALLLMLLGCVREWLALGTVFGLPLFILALHLVCFYAESRETKKNRNPVLRTVLLWFCPAVSLLGGAVTLGTGLGYEMHISTVVPVFVGLLFLILGNYLPKIRQNRTMGIKLPWTLQSEENWTRTHRLSGFLWVLCGLVMIPLSLLRLWSGWLFGALLAVMVLIPAVYSYALHRKGI